MPDDHEFYLTRTGYEKLQRELDLLLSEESEEVAALLADAHEGEEGEEATFYEALFTKERLDERIAHLRMILAQAEIIEEDPDPDRVSPGNRVTVWDFSEQEEITFDLLSSQEISHGRLKGVSLSSPVGKALRGRRVGDVVEVQVPDGMVRYAIRKIDSIPSNNH